MGDEGSVEILNLFTEKATQNRIRRHRLRLLQNT